MKEKPKITKEMTIVEVFEKHPKTATIFTGYGLHCAGCPMSQSETIGAIAELHQVDLKKLLEDLNKAAE